MQALLITPLFTLLGLRWLAIRYPQYNTVVGEEQRMLQFLQWVSMLQRLIIYLEHIKARNLVDKWVLAYAIREIECQYRVAKSYLNK